MRYSWNWDVVFTEPYLGYLLTGVRWTVLVAAAAWVLAFCLGSVLGVLRTVRHPAVRIPVTAYVELFRNLPLILQMFLWYFVLPEVLPASWGTWLKRDLPDAEFWTAVLCLGLYTAVRVGEQLRAGIESIAGGQRAAGLASGLSELQVYRHVLLPIAYRIILPALTTEFLSIFKNSSIALTVGVLELTAQTRRISEYTFQPIEMFLTATAIYVMITLGVAGIMRVIEGRTRLRGMVSAGAA